MLVGCYDSSFACCLADTKSTSDYVFKMTSESVSWKSDKQTLSAIQAKFYHVMKPLYKHIWIEEFYISASIS